MKKALLITTLALVPLPALADVGFLVGGAVTRDQSNLDEIVERGLGTSASSPDAETGTDIYLGLAINDIVTFRLGHRRFGDAETTSAYAGGYEAELEADGVYLAVDALFPVTDTIYLGGTLGTQRVVGKVTEEWMGTGAYMKDDARDFFYGLRAKWMFHEHIAVTGSFNRYQFEVSDAEEDFEYDSLALGLEYHF